MRWIVMTLVAGGAAIAAFTRRVRNRSRQLDVGAVSHDWLANHRADRFQ
jgi:hypothetical protein